MPRGDKIQDKIWKALGKASNKLGRSYEVFHPTSADEPVKTSNSIGILPVWFEVKPGSSYEFNAMFDPNKLRFFKVQIGDYFFDMTNNEYYFITNINLLANNIEAILCNSIIDVSRASYVGADSVEAVIFKNIPAHVQSGSASSDSSYIPVSNTSSAPIQNYSIMTGSPANSFKLRDKVIDKFGNESEITDAVWDNGYSLKTNSYATSD